MKGSREECCKKWLHLRAGLILHMACASWDGLNSTRTGTGTNMDTPPNKWYEVGPCPKHVNCPGSFGFQSLRKAEGNFEFPPFGDNLFGGRPIPNPKLVKHLPRPNACSFTNMRSSNIRVPKYVLVSMLRPCKTTPKRCCQQKTRCAPAPCEISSVSCSVQRPKRRPKKQSLRAAGKAYYDPLAKKWQLSRVC